MPYAPAGHPPVRLCGVDAVQRWQASTACETACFLGGLCGYSMWSAAGKGCAPHRVATTFSHSPIDSKKKIRYTVPYLHNRFFDNRNSDSCPLSESSKMRSKVILVALVSHSICTESLILAQNERWRRT